MTAFYKYIIPIICFALPFLVEGQRMPQDTVKYVVRDTSMHEILPEIRVYPTPDFENKRMERRYWKLVRDVKIALPYARQISSIVHEVEDTLGTFQTDKQKRKFLKSKEKELFAEFEKPMRNLTFSQGKLLIKLVDRECSETSFELVKLYRGGLTAFFWQSFAVILGANLKTEYEADTEDALVEHVIFLVEHGYL